MVEERRIEVMKVKAYWWRNCRRWWKLFKLGMLMWRDS